MTVLMQFTRRPHWVRRLAHSPWHCRGSAMSFKAETMSWFTISAPQAQPTVRSTGPDEPQVEMVAMVAMVSRVSQALHLVAISDDNPPAWRQP